MDILEAILQYVTWLRNWDKNGISKCQFNHINFLFIYYKGPSWKHVWIVCGSVTWLMKCEGRGCEGRVYTGDLFSQHDTADGRMEVAKGCLEVKALWGGVLPEQTVGGVAQARILGIVHSVLARKS